MEQPVWDAQRGYFDKWEMDKLLHLQASALPYQLPETLQFSTPACLAMLTKYKSVYVKPVDTWGGSAVSKLWYEGNCVTLRGQNETRVFANAEACVDHLADIYGQRSAIVQQTAPVRTWHGHPCDFRVHMQREVAGKWVFAGVLVRVAGVGGVVSNVAASHGRVLPVQQVLNAFYGHAVAFKRAICSNLEESGYATCHLLDAYAEFEEVGVDLGIGKGGQLWLFEVNTNDACGGPSRELFAQLPDSSTYQQMQDRVAARTQQLLDDLARALL